MQYSSSGSVKRLQGDGPFCFPSSSSKDLASAQNEKGVDPGESERPREWEVGSVPSHCSSRCGTGVCWENAYSALVSYLRHHGRRKRVCLVGAVSVLCRGGVGVLSVFVMLLYVRPLRLVAVSVPFHGHH